ncbi:MAG: hypothetical protein JW900_01285 [Anaerolineae bacterium]|nr:hypothetical protein [Anaerolineae bacterium]
MSKRERPPARFIGAPVEALFDQTPTLEKRPGAPDGFIWNERAYRVVALLQEWHDYRRRGRMAANMRPSHAAAAGRRGSWGVGRDYYRVRTAGGEVFDIYYDRAPHGVDQRKGAWFLFRQILERE